jgi:hypothetical protein
MTTNTHVIVLAQGTQKRMEHARHPKQLLTLTAHEAACAPNTRILPRTLMQVGVLLGGRYSTFGRHMVEVVTWPTVWHDMNAIRMPPAPFAEDRISEWVPGFHCLPDPGNSSIRGIARYLRAMESPRHQADIGRTIVLLGDVLYSWACLEALFSDRDVVFAGTSDLGRDRGELWGIAWDHRTSGRMMTGALELAVAASSKHEDEYQPGQMRHWLWAVDRHLNPNGLTLSTRDWWVPIDDYTMDVDLPEHLTKLAAASWDALADDLGRHA